MRCRTRLFLLLFRLFPGCRARIYGVFQLSLVENRRDLLRLSHRCCYVRTNVREAQRGGNRKMHTKVSWNSANESV